MAVRSILHALDYKDHYTFGHSMRVAFYALIIGKEIGLTNQELYALELTALCHDIGKIGIPDSILLKPTRLDDRELGIMKTHPVKSAEILGDFTYFGHIVNFVKHHHERYDGKGYPDGISEDDIPLFSRIILVTDTFDAMTSSRPYRKGLDTNIAFDELVRFSGTQFDPLIVTNFLKAMAKEHMKQVGTFSLNIVNGRFKKDAA